MDRVQRGFGWLAAVTLLGVTPATAQLYDSGSTGVLGPLMPTADVAIPLPEDGVLDYTVIDIPAGVTVTFVKNQADTPVYLLATGDVTVAGTIDVSGQKGKTVNSWQVTAIGGVGGPAAGDGASYVTGTGLNAVQTGYGPGGGLPYANNPSSNYGASGGASPVTGGAATYHGPAGGKAYADSDTWIQFGGSGGGSTYNYSGGGGGGVLTIASSGVITVTGQVLANGGSNWGYGGGGGGGGVLRLVANQILGDGTIQARGGGRPENHCDYHYGGCGGDGIIHLEGYDITGGITKTANPLPKFGTPANALPYPPSKRPTLTISTVDGVAAAYGPAGTHVLDKPAMNIPQNLAITVVVAAENVPPGTVVKVAVNTLEKGRKVYDTAALAGTLAASTASVDVTVPAGARVGAIEAWIPQIPIPTL